MSHRPAMLASVIRDLLAPALRTVPPACGIASITDVEVSPDVSVATVYVSALRDADAAVAHLERQRHALQRSLSELRSKRIPLLRFRVDDRGEKGRRIDELLGM